MHYPRPNTHSLCVVQVFFILSFLYGFIQCYSMSTSGWIFRRTDNMRRLLNWCPTVNTPCLSQVYQAPSRLSEPITALINLPVILRSPSVLWYEYLLWHLPSALNQSKPEQTLPKNPTGYKWTSSRLCLRYFPSVLFQISLLFSFLFLIPLTSHYSHLWCPTHLCVRVHMLLVG